MVRQLLAREGRARVLVQLRLPGGDPVAEGHLTPAAVAVQRSDIAAAGAQVLARLAARNHQLLHRYESVAFLALEVDAAALTELEAAPLFVRAVVEDGLNRPSLADSVPLIGGTTAWARGFDGTGVVVGIVDTGVDASHPFLAGKVVEEACYSSTVSGHSTTVCPNGTSSQTGPGSAVPCPIGDCWHGTHVAGIAAGNGAGAGVSFSGVAKGAQIIAVQVFSKFTKDSDCGGPGTAPCALAYTSDIIQGLERVYALRTTRNIASANLSLGGGLFTAPCDGEPEKTIIDNLRSVGIATVIAAGNDGSPNALESPGCISSAVSVGSTTKADAISSFSNVASFMSLFAPGSSIQSSIPGGSFAFASGTSMATPHVTGAWAVLKQAVPAGTVTQFLNTLQSTGLPITDTRSGTPVTRPRIRLDQALALLVPPSPATLALAYNGKLRDRVHGADLAVGGDGDLDGTLTATLSGSGGRTITGLDLRSSAGGIWETTTVTANWGLGAALSLDGALLNNPATMAVNFTVADGGSFVVFASEYLGIQFSPGVTLTLTATFSDGTTAQGVTTVTASGPTVNTVTPNQGAAGATVPVTIDGSGFVSGATVSAGAGITVSNVVFVSAARLTANFAIAAGATAGARNVSVTNPGGAPATLVNGFTVTTPATVALALVYNGKLRDRVHGADLAVGGDGDPDGTLTATLSAPGGRTITGLDLRSSAGGIWETTTVTANWGLGAALSLDGALLNNPATMAVNFAVADGGSFVVFASEYLGIQFSPGVTLTLTATFSDGTTAQGVTTVSASGPTVNAVTPNQGTAGTTVPVTIDGSGFASGATVSAGAGITVSNVVFVSSARLTASFGIAAGAAAGARNVTVTNPGGTPVTLVNGFTVTTATLALVYNGKLRDRVHGADLAVGGDGDLDGTLTATLSAPGGRTITGLDLRSSAGGIWETTTVTANWGLGVALSLDGALLNNPATMAVNFTVGDGGSFVVFASEYLGIQFLPGVTLTLTATFSDGTSAVGAVLVP